MEQRGRVAVSGNTGCFRRRFGGGYTVSGRVITICGPEIVRLGRSRPGWGCNSAEQAASERVPINSRKAPGCGFP